MPPINTLLHTEIEKFYEEHQPDWFSITELRDNTGSLLDKYHNPSIRSRLDSLTRAGKLEMKEQPRYPGAGYKTLRWRYAQ